MSDRVDEATVVTAIEQRVYDLLEKGPLTAWELMAETKWGESPIFSALKSLRAQGRITSTRTTRGHGRGSGRSVSVYSALPEAQR